MSRLAGRNARVYLEQVSGAAATPLAFQASWQASLSTNKIDVTAFGDAGKVTVNGLPAQTGAFAGFYDDSTAQAYTAATDGLARKLYLYWNTLNNSQYLFGTVNVDMTFDVSVDGAATVSASWAAASNLIKSG